MSRPFFFTILRMLITFFFLHDEQQKKNNMRAKEVLQTFWCNILCIFAFDSIKNMLGQFNIFCFVYFFKVTIA